MFVAKMVEIFAEVWRVLRDDGTVWLNLGDSYITHSHGSKRANAEDPKWAQARHRGRVGSGIGQANRTHINGLKHKDMVGIPWTVAFALRDAGWYLRTDIIWAKKNPMPESVTDRPTKSHEYLFLLTKQPKYFYDAEAVREQQTGNTHSRGKGLTPKTAKRAGDDLIKANETFHETTAQWHKSPDGNRNLRSVWRLSSESYKGTHFATFPTSLVTPCIKAGTSEKGCCPACETPWRRMVTKERKTTRPGKNTKISGRKGGCNGTSGEYSPDGRASFRSSEEVGNRDPQRHCTVTKTVGWEPGCKCGREDVVSPIVLDPFGGAATTVLVACRLGRRGLCCDLNEGYVDMGRRRVREDMPLFA